jgi:hypothetical protein
LARVDGWRRRSDWLPEPEERFPSGAFWGIFLWNLPILFLALAAIGTVLYQSDPDSSGTGFFTTLNWMVELGIGSLAIAIAVDLGGCLWLRRLWNRRARWIRTH